MADGNRSRSNTRLRAHLNRIIEPLPVGERFKTDTIKVELAKTRRNLYMTTRRASILIRERRDVQLVGRGVWQKVPCGVA